MFEVIILLLGVLLFFYLYYFSEKEIIKRWRRDYPTKKEYIKKNPYSKTRLGVSCFACKSRALNETGLIKSNDENKKVDCGICNAKLYRVESKLMKNI